MLIHSDITSEPLLRVVEILNKAMTRNLVDWNAMNIATVSLIEQPSSRMVLLKKIDERGFVFIQTLKAKKARKLTLITWWL